MILKKKGGKIFAKSEILFALGDKNIENIETIQISSHLTHNLDEKNWVKVWSDFKSWHLSK